MNSVAIILARSGSKGIPNKNMIEFCGLPLVSWSILQAKHAAKISEVYVSSDGDDILGLAEHYGVRTIYRPLELALDESTSEQALQHAIQNIQNIPEVDLIVFLQPTSPLREPDDIDKAISIICDQGFDSLFSANELHDICLWKNEDSTLNSITYEHNSRMRRQEKPPFYLENGSIYIFKPSVLSSMNNRLGGKIGMYLMPSWKSHEIDCLEDIELCEYYFNRNMRIAWQHMIRSDFINPERIDLIVYDFDGVMTDNRAILDQNGIESVLINRGDGLGVSFITDLGIDQIIISMEENKVVSARGKKLGLNTIQGCRDKKTTLEQFCDENQIDLSRVLYVGNDLNDYDVMGIVGVSVAPKDAHPAILKIANFITESYGGHGVIRELAEKMIKEKKRTFLKLVKSLL